MLEQPNHTGERRGSITVVTAHGQASFRQLQLDQPYLDVEYGQPALRADLTRQSLPRAVAALCDEEVARMREALGAVAGSLARQVRQEGLRPVIDRRWEQKDVRDWTRTETDFQVRATHTRMRDELDGSEGASDAVLIQETVRQMMEQREQAFGTSIAESCWATRGRGTPRNQSDEPLRPDATAEWTTQDAATNTHLSPSKGGRKG